MIRRKSIIFSPQQKDIILWTETNAQFDVFIDRNDIKHGVSNEAQYFIKNKISEQNCASERLLFITFFRRRLEFNFFPHFFSVLFSLRRDLEGNQIEIIQEKSVNIRTDQL